MMEGTSRRKAVMAEAGPRTASLAFATTGRLVLRRGAMIVLA